MNYKNNKRNTIVACLGFSLAGAVYAQTNVQVYGLLNVNVSGFKAGSARGGDTVWKMTDGTVNGPAGSRVGFRAVEDLGNGLKAMALLESGFGVDTGSSFQGGRLFGRQVFVSLASANYGELRFGRQYTPSGLVNGMVANPILGLAMNPTLPVSNNTGLLPQWFDIGRMDNVVQYLSPKFGGFDMSVFVAPGENVNDRYHAAQFNYVQGPFRSALAYESNKDRLTGANTNKLTSVAASYNFGPFKLSGGVQQAKDVTTNTGNVGGLTNLRVTGATTFVADEITTYTGGVAIPVGKALTTAINYTRTKYTGQGNSATLGKVGLGAIYDLSKRTNLYGGFTVATGDLNDYILEDKVFQIGISTSF